MLERYLYSVSKKKKMLFIFLISVIFVSLVSYRVNCGMFDWLVDDITDNITDEIFSAINQSIGEAIGSVLDFIVNAVINPLGPSLTTFTENTNMGSISLIDFINRFAIFTGMFLSTIIFGFGICVYFFTGKLTDSKDTPISLFAKYILAMIICYKHESIYTTILDIFDEFYSTMTETLFAEEFGELGLTGIITDGAGDEVVAFGETLVIRTYFPGVGLILLIIELILIWKLLKGFLKLYCEMVSRYIVTMVLVLLFAVFGGTIVSNNTSSIFKSYLRTVFSSCLLLIFNMVWFKGCIFAVFGGDCLSILQYIFVIELLALGLKMDGILRSMGLGVATGGARIGAAIGGAGRSLANAMRLANDARKSGAKVMGQHGLASGNPTMLNMANVLGGNFDALRSSNGLGDPFAMASAYGKQGQKIPDDKVSPKDVASMLNRAAKNPGDQDAANAVKGLSDKKVLEGAQYMAAPNGINVSKATPIDFNGADGKRHSGIRIEGERTQMGPNGKETTHAVKGVIGDEKGFRSSQDLGNGMGMRCDNSLKNGERCSISEAPDLAGQDAADAIKSAKDNGIDFGENGMLEKAGKDSNGLDAFNCYDSDGNQLGTISGDEFIAASDINATPNDNDRLADARDELLNNGVEDLSDFEATGFTATAMDKMESSPIGLSMQDNDDGTVTGIFTNSDGESASFTSEKGASLEEALSSDEAKNAISCVAPGGEVSGFIPTGFTAVSTSADAIEPVKASFEPGADGSFTGTISNGAGESASFTVPKGTSIEDALSSEEAQSAFSSVAPGTTVSDFEATGFTAADTDAYGNESFISASFEDNGDGSYTGIVKNAAGEISTFSVPDGMSFEDSLSSEAGMEALSRVAGDDEVSDFMPNEYTAAAIDENASRSLIHADFEQGDDGIFVGTVTNGAGESASFTVPQGMSFEDSLSSPGAQNAIAEVAGDDYVGSFEATDYSAISTVPGEGDSSNISARFDKNDDGSYTGTISDENGRSSSFDVPEGTGFKQALDSEDGRAALSDVAGDREVSAFTPSEYSASSRNADGSSSDYKVSFNDNNDGTYTGTITDSNGNESTYTSMNGSIASDIRNEIASTGAYDSVSEFEKVDGKTGVYRASATSGDYVTNITATDKGIYSRSQLNDNPESFLYSGADRNGNHIKYDVNVGEARDSTMRQSGKNRTYDQRFEEESANGGYRTSKGNKRNRDDAGYVKTRKRGGF